MEKGITSPFWQPNQLPPEVQSEVDMITRQMQPAIDRLCRLVRDHDLHCFEIGGGMHGIGVTLGVHNPNAPHPDMPDIDEVMGDPAEFLRSMGLPVPPGAHVQVMAHKLPRNGERHVKPPIASPGAPQRATAGVWQPPEDLLAGIEVLLRQMFPSVKDTEVLGAIFSPHKSAALEIGKIMEAARKRDRDEILRRMTDFLNTFKS